MIRCVKCGCSKLKLGVWKCARCDGSPAVRGEQVRVTFDTKAKLLASATELRRFGITLELLKPHELLCKLMDGPDGSGLVLNVDDSLDSDTLREAVDYLRWVGVPEQEVLSLRLADPGDVIALYRVQETV